VKPALLIALALLTGLLPREGQESPRPGARRDPVTPLLEAAAAAPIRAWLELEPREVEIGEPVECTLVVEHEPDVSLRIKPQELALDASWLALSLPRLASVDSGLRPRLRARWSLASLEPGLRSIELPPLRYEQDGVLQLLPVPALELRVRSALAEGEDAPRQPAGFRPAPPEAERPSRRGWALGGGLFALIGASVLALRLRGRRRPLATTAPDPRRRLEELCAGPAARIEEPAAFYLALSAGLRELFDAAAGRDRRGASDPEWLRALEEDGLPAEIRSELARFLERAERVEFGAERPTRFALEEDRDLALRLAERVGGAPEGKG
jgi:hypothetical protein